MKNINIPKNELISKILAIIKKGWIHSDRSRNDGAVGNTLEDLLNIPENNLAIANTVDWELKAQRINTTSLTTLFHQDPEPRKPNTVISSYLLPNYGWPHKEAGQKYSINEMSFRATLSDTFSDRGFCIKVNSIDRRIELAFDYRKVGSRHKEWLSIVKNKVGLKKITPTPYWNFDDLHKKCVGKIKNTIFVLADSRNNNGQEEFKYEKILLLEDFAFNNFLRGIISGDVYIDFDARTGHNHGTKFRIRQKRWDILYSKITEVK
ncbi:MAG: hypothetical protein A2314_09140 [Elusimicrobia bacterium RIFOXYB2_FULL_50_12]|nr:MAG: hypothetical protein A2314_09140 [Elusimicrobia bacterium RIFOXYB2_FULL_50_12]